MSETDMPKCEQRGSVQSRNLELSENRTKESRVYNRLSVHFLLSVRRRPLCVYFACSLCCCDVAWELGASTDRVGWMRPAAFLLANEG